VELMREAGFSYKDMEADDCHLPVVEASCRYRAPARYDETLTVETRVDVPRHSLFKFSYRLTRGAGDGLPAVLLAEAETTHILVDGEMKMRKLPERYAAALKAVSEAEW
jgi:acyl-CoA thioester hydrolase